MLTWMRSLTDINVMKNNLKEADIDVLAKIAQTHQTERKLNLADTGFGKFSEKSVNLLTVLRYSFAALF